MISTILLLMEAFNKNKDPSSNDSWNNSSVLVKVVQLLLVRQKYLAIPNYPRPPNFSKLTRHHIMRIVRFYIFI